jgi:hypothetical protein
MVSENGSNASILLAKFACGIVLLLLAEKTRIFINGNDFLLSLGRFRISATAFYSSARK